jgi:hypothetical protein
MHPSGRYISHKDQKWVEVFLPPQKFNFVFLSCSFLCDS